MFAVSLVGYISGEVAGRDVDHDDDDDDDEKGQWNRSIASLRSELCANKKASADVLNFFCLYS